MTLVLTCLMIHDYSGPAGPIEQQRFAWFVGSEWFSAYEAAIEAEPCLPPPSVTITLQADARPIANHLTRVRDEALQRDEELRRQIEVHYARASGDHLGRLLGVAPPRKPRALLITSLFTTVLQHVTRDVSAALQNNGWEVETLIEPASHHRVTGLALRHVLAELKPDLMFQLDHLRREHGDLIPKNLPYVCWVQDHLPNLTSGAAGKSIGLRDFVFTGMAPMYTGLYNYPRRQCIPLAKLTRVPTRPTRWPQDGDDLVYVSNASAEPQILIEQLLDRCRGAADAEAFVRSCANHMVEIYRAGENLPTMYDVGRVVDAVHASHTTVLLGPEQRQQVVHSLFHPLNDALYRQQALTWVAQVAQERNLSFSIYGAGWDQHSKLTCFARGPVQYGADLEELTRRTRINLQIVPYFCLHQRLLDGLVAGGFFLVRRHPSDVLLLEMANFLDVHLDPTVSTVDDARRTIAAEHRVDLEELLERCACLCELAGPIDLVDWTRCCQQAQLIAPGREVLPHLEEVCFNDAASLEAAIDRFISDAGGRDRIAAAQRQMVERHHTYGSGLRRVFGRIGELIAEENQGSASPHQDRSRSAA